MAHSTSYLLVSDRMEVEEAGFDYCIYMFIKFKVRVKKHPKVFGLGFDKGGQVAKVIFYLQDGVGWTK